MADTTKYTVSGIIYDEHNSPLANTQVKIYEVDLRSETPLGTVTTDAQGSYNFGFVAELAEPEYKTPDICITVQKAGSRALLGKSPIYFNIRPETTIDYRIGDSKVLSINEFDRLIALLSPLIEVSKLTFDQLEETTDKNKDISFLSGETGEDFDVITALAQAHRLFISTKIPPEIFYSLLRLGFPSELSELLDIQSNSIKKAVEQAVSDNIISSKILKDLLGAITDFNTLALRQMNEGEVEKSTRFKTIIGAVLKDKKQQHTFLKTWYENEAEPEQFWEELKKKEGFKTGKNLENTQKLFEINTLTAGQPELTASLYTKLSSGTAVKELSTLAALSVGDWEKEIADAKVKNFPGGVEGETEKEKIASYATSLEGLYKELYPTIFFAERFKADTKTAFDNKTELIKFFSNNPAFDLSGIGIVKALDQADYTGIGKKEEVQENIKTIARQKKLVGNNYTAINTLQSKGLNSASAIVRKFGKQQFVKEFGTALGGEVEAENAYSKSVSLSNRAAALVVSEKFKYDTPIHVMNAGTPSGYHEMFGDGELCDCEHCQSVYSPAAYFVDMLSCIRKEGDIDANHDGAVYRKLISRRPDLEYIELSCENANTPLPYIDLVNELLEKEVSDAERNHSFQTTAVPELLDAMAEHKIIDAYNQLKTISAESVFSDLLPFDEPLEQVKLYTEKLGWNRHEFASLLNGTDSSMKYSNPDLAKAWFGASLASWDAISKIWSFTLNVPADGKVSQLLRLMKITYVDLLQLLESYFLNPERDGIRSIKIIQENERTEKKPVLTCNLDELLLEGISSDWLKKAAKFIRLWKITGWDLFDLDRAFMAFGLFEFPSVGEFDRKVLVPLYQTDLLKQRFKISTREALTLTKDIETKNYRDHRKEGQPLMPSFYQYLFENRSLAITEEPSVVEKLAAALETSVAEIKALDIAVSDPDIQVLSKIYRSILLSKKLRMPVTEMKDLFNIMGSSLGVNAEWDATSLLQLIDEASISAAAGVLPSNFYALLQSKTGAEHVYDISDGFIEFITEKSGEFETIAAIADETERNSQTLAKIEELINQFPDNIEWIKGKTAQSEDDKTLNKLIESFTNPDSIVVLKTWNLEDLVGKLGELLNVAEAYRKYEPTPAIFKVFGFTEERIIWLKENRVHTDTVALWDNDISSGTPGIYRAYEKLFFLSRLNKGATITNEKDWTMLFDEAIKEDGVQDDYFILTSELFGLSNQSLDFASIKLGLNFHDDPNLPNDYIDSTKVITLINAATAINKLLVSQEQLDALLNSEPNEAAAVSVQNLLKSNYNNDEWLKTIKPINDTLREKRRNALVAYLIAERPEWQKPVDIYKHLLIDTEMDACMDTSRIKQAISSLQLFIDRCLMGLEPDLTLSDDFAKQWNEWRKQYRVWEANRKIFLYPENWIEPEFRDDKSPFFKELESQLKQNEVTEETAKEVLLTYLYKLDNVAKLEMVGLFNDDETGILHVVGRTPNIPHQYFYRTQFKNIWSAWEKVELDVEGDHILPVVWNGRLMLFWGQFTEKQLPSKGNSTTISNPNAGNGENDLVMNTPALASYFEMKLAWSEYKNAKWGGKKISKEVCPLTSILIINEYTAQIALDKVLITSDINFGELSINIFKVEDSGSLSKLNGKFKFDGCNSTPKFEVGNSESLRSLQQITGDELLVSSSTSNWLRINGRYFFKPKEIASGPIILTKPPLFSLLATERHNLHLAKRPKFFLSGSIYVLYGEGIVNGILDNRPIFDSGLNNEYLILKREANPLSYDSSMSKSAKPDYVSYSKSSSNSPFQRKYTFKAFYHSNPCSFIKTINQHGIPAIYTQEIQTQDTKVLFTEENYDPTDLVKQPFPFEGLDYSVNAAYSLYNWELFYHTPLTIASQLMQNQKFDEARKWLHYIFNPTVSGNQAEGAKRFWITKPFREEIDNLVSLEDLLQNPEHLAELAAQLDYWEDHPFNPHAVARFRISAYMRKTVLLYLDNLIKWGDQLFAKDTIESINEATLLYVLAGEILGEKQQIVPPRSKPKTRSYGGPEGTSIKDSLDAFNNSLTDVETVIPAGTGDVKYLQMFYFCLPKNDFLLKYWDTIEDRLFKIRNCMNISGQVRSLALFEPPIDPAMLVRAAAAGLSISDVLDATVTLPNYRFQVILQKANELCNDVKGLGSQLLSAIDKKDAETLSLLRSTNELNMLGVLKSIKKLQRDEAKENLGSLYESKKIIDQRFQYYNSRDFMNGWEIASFYSSYLGIGLQSSSSEAKALSATLHIVPDTKLGSGFTIGLTTGGSTMGAAADAGAEVLHGLGIMNSAIGMVTNTMGSYQRRMDDWQFQAKSAELELKQIDKQIAAAEIRLAIADQDLENHTLQTDQSREVDDYMRSKFSNAELYNWMVGQLSTVYFQSYQLAYSTAKKAEKCMQHELGIEDSNYIKFGYWNSLKQGLLSGETLQFDLRVLENAYLEQNIREMEITKHISLAIHDSEAIEELKNSGACDFDIIEKLFDLDFAGHYRRRIKSVSISIPCIAGPYTSVSATLSLTKSSYRKNTDLSGGGYPESTTGDDTRFIKNFGNGVKSIATSHGQNDSGMFELNFRDERYLPFEGCGVISSWRLELPTEVKPFVYDTISDVIVHIKYTARDGGNAFKVAVNDFLKSL